MAIFYHKLWKKAIGNDFSKVTIPNKIKAYRKRNINVIFSKLKRNNFYVIIALRKKGGDVNGKENE